MRLHALLARLTLCEHTTGDLMQELFIKLGSSSAFDKARDPLAYACRTAINLALDWRRRRKIAFQQWDENFLPVGDHPSALDHAIRSEEFQQTLDAIAKLSELARSVIVMRYIEQQSYDEIARHLGKKPQHLRSVSAKALAQMRKLLTKEKNLVSNE